MQCYVSVMIAQCDDIMADMIAMITFAMPFSSCPLVWYWLQCGLMAAFRPCHTIVLLLPSYTGLKTGLHKLDLVSVHLLVCW
jgi:hypothetical protein